MHTTYSITGLYWYKSTCLLVQKYKCRRTCTGAHNSRRTEINVMRAEVEAHLTPPRELAMRMTGRDVVLPGSGCIHTMPASSSVSVSSKTSPWRYMRVRVVPGAAAATRSAEEREVCASFWPTTSTEKGMPNPVSDM